MSNEDVTEKLERTDRGYRLSIESTRGTGTRDQDKVKAELRTEQRPSENDRAALRTDVKAAMESLRSFDPDADGDGE